MKKQGRCTASPVGFLDIEVPIQVAHFFVDDNHTIHPLSTSDSLSDCTEQTKIRFIAKCQMTVLAAKRYAKFSMLKTRKLTSFSNFKLNFQIVEKYRNLQCVPSKISTGHTCVPIIFYEFRGSSTLPLTKTNLKV